MNLGSTAPGLRALFLRHLINRGLTDFNLGFIVPPVLPTSEGAIQGGEQMVTDRGNERLYQEYRKERDDGVSHAQIVADGWCTSDAEAFALRYSLAQAAYVDAFKRRDCAHTGTEYAPDGRVIGVDDKPAQRIPDRPTPEQYR